MRKIVKEFNVYKIEELTGINRVNALHSVLRDYVEEWQEFSTPELLQSMKKAAGNFGLRLTSWSIGLFDRSHAEVDVTLFDDEQGPYALEWIKEQHAEGIEGSCPFTGHHFDCYFFDYFGDAVADDITAGNIAKHIARAVAFILEKAIDAAESDALNDEYLEQYTEEQTIEFHADGTIFRG